MTIGYVSHPSKWRRYVIFFTGLVCLSIVGLVINERWSDLKRLYTEHRASNDLEKAKLLTSSGNHVEARKIFNRLINERVHEISAWKSLAVSWETEGYSDAWWAYTRAALLDANDVTAAQKAIRLISELRYNPIFEVVAVELANLHPTNKDIQLGLSRVLTEARRFQDADDVLADLLRLYPVDQKILRERTALHARGRGFAADAAQKKLEEYLQVAFEPDDIYWALQANALVLLNPANPHEVRQKALDLLDRALSIKQDSWQLRLRKFLLVREFAPERARRVMEDLWQNAVRSNLPGRQLDAIRIILDLPPTALSYIRQLPSDVRMGPEAALLEIQALHGTAAWNEIRSIADKLSESSDVNPFYKVFFNLWTARSLNARNASENEIRLFIDRALGVVASQNDKILALSAANTLNQWMMNDHLLAFLNNAATSNGEIRYSALRGMTSIRDRLTPRNTISIYRELHLFYPRDAAIAAEAADVFLANRFDLPFALLMAEVAYRTDPAHVPFADVYARALAANNRRAEALAVYNAMPPSAFDDRRIRTNMESLRVAGSYTILPGLIQPTVTEETSILTDENSLAMEVLSLLKTDRLQALQLARRLHNSNPRNLWAIHAFALSLAADGQFERAIELLSPAVVSVLPKHPQVLLDFAEILAAAKRHDRCLEILDLIDPETLDPDFREKHTRLHAAAQRELLTTGG